MMVKGALQAVRDTDLHENNAIIDLNEMMLSVIELHNQYQTQVEFEPAVIEPLVAKPLAIKRVLTNLIDNAVKYGQSAEVDISSDSVWVIVTIQDHGKGIPEDKLELVFEPYFRLATDDQGHGLGLGICRNILHGHGGDLIIRNSSQGGLEAKVYIPRGLEV